VQRAFQNPQLLCDLVQVETELLIRVAERVLERNQKKPSQSVSGLEAIPKGNGTRVTAISIDQST
jgi:hypothetical protein